MTQHYDSRGAGRLVEKMTTLLGQGGSTTTYGYAVLLGLLDLCLEKGARDGAPPDSVTTHELAAKIIEIYFGQAGEFDGRVLRQSVAGQAKILSLIVEFRAKHAAEADALLYRSQRRAPKAYARLTQKVEWRLVEMPLLRLQRVGGELDDFLFAVGWDETVSRDVFLGAGFDNVIRFKPDVPRHLVALSGVLRPVLQRHWAALVTRVNGLTQTRLEQFLFGQGSDPLMPVAPHLYDLQRGRCFYCGVGIRGGLDVDYFMPWSRHPDSGLDNLVAVHERCAAQKAEFLPDTGHVARWAEHITRRSSELEQISNELVWPRDAARTLAALQTVYAHLPDDARLWHIKNEFEVLDRELLVDTFLLARPS